MKLLLLRSHAWIAVRLSHLPPEHPSNRGTLRRRHRRHPWTVLLCLMLLLLLLLLLLLQLGHGMMLIRLLLVQRRTRAPDAAVSRWPPPDEIWERCHSLR